MGKQRIFIDTMIIIELFRSGCWSAACNKYSMETVEKCVEEALAGDSADPRYVPVDRAELLGGLSELHVVSRATLAAFALQCSRTAEGLDDGEKHLLALLYAHGAQINAQLLISTADKAAIVAVGKLNWLDNLISLEEMVNASGVTRSQLECLRSHFSKEWLDSIKMKVLLGIIP